MQNGGILQPVVDISGYVLAITVSVADIMGVEWWRK
jgi:hypothetical protein